MTLSEETARLILERIKNRSTLVCGLAARMKMNTNAFQGVDRSAPIDAIAYDATLIERNMQVLTTEVEELLQPTEKDASAHLGVSREAE